MSTIKNHYQCASCGANLPELNPSLPPGSNKFCEYCGSHNPNFVFAQNVFGTDEFEPGEDPLYGQAVEVVMTTNRVSISFVQRRLRIGYNRAARLVEDMEKAGLVSAMNADGERKILNKNTPDL